MPPAPTYGKHRCHSNSGAFSIPNTLLLGCGLPGVGKSAALRAVHAAVPSSVLFDKDTINQALLQGRPYFSPYYFEHVQQQTYHVMFSLAADNLGVPPHLRPMAGHQAAAAAAATAAAANGGEPELASGEVVPLAGGLQGTNGTGQQSSLSLESELAFRTEARCHLEVAGSSLPAATEPERGPRGCARAGQGTERQPTAALQPTATQRQQQQCTDNTSNTDRRSSAGPDSSSSSSSSACSAASSSVSGRLVLLDGQFGDKLSASYVRPWVSGGHGFRTVVVYFHCSAQEQERRMRTRGEARDDDKYVRLAALRAQWLAAHERELQDVQHIAICTDGRDVASIADELLGALATHNL